MLSQVYKALVLCSPCLLYSHRQVRVHSKAWYKTMYELLVRLIRFSLIPPLKWTILHSCTLRQKPIFVSRSSRKSIVYPSSYFLLPLIIPTLESIIITQFAFLFPTTASSYAVCGVASLTMWSIYHHQVPSGVHNPYICGWPWHT